jgi:hypothetical protein
VSGSMRPVGVACDTDSVFIEGRPLRYAVKLGYSKRPLRSHSSLLEDKERSAEIRRRDRPAAACQDGRCLNDNGPRRLCSCIPSSISSDRSRPRSLQIFGSMIDWFRRRPPFSIDAASYHVNPPISTGSGHAMNGCSESISDKPVVHSSGFCQEGMTGWAGQEALNHEAASRASNLCATAST